YRVTYPEGFDLIKVTNGATAQTIKFGVSRDGQGDYNIGSSLLVGGAVDTVGDIIGNRAIARNLYSVAIQQAAVVSQYATLRVVPTSGTRNLIKKVGIAIQGTSAALIRMGFSNAAFAGLGSKLVVNHDGGIYSPISSPYNGTIYGGVTTSPLSGNGLVYNKFLQANDLEFDISPHHPYIADSDNGYDFIIQCSTANVACALSVELEEF
ncbi:MAG: hypothetical protein KJO69_02820, partial [Gammaproteobacteria bacterium]|nr:hypothetical protein [Gammaproteobacteria bacterium]